MVKFRLIFKVTGFNSIHMEIIEAKTKAGAKGWFMKKFDCLGKIEILSIEEVRA